MDKSPEHKRLERRNDLTPHKFSPFNQGTRQVKTQRTIIRMLPDKDILTWIHRDDDF